MNVTHQPERKCFAVVQEDEEAVLEYRLSQQGAVDFCRTFVPEGMRGQGVAADLVAKGVGWARAQGLSISASCSYVQKWLEREQR